MPPLSLPLPEAATILAATGIGGIATSGLLLILRLLFGAALLFFIGLLFFLLRREQDSERGA